MDEREYSFIKYKVRKLLGIDLDSYKSTQVQRRLKTYLLRAGQPNWPAFFHAIQDDPEKLADFRDYITINVSYFFRDSDKFEHLRQAILPELLKKRAKLRVWSAGCSHGHEPYSLAILLAEATNLYRQHVILATDIDQSALRRAQAGGPYSEEEASAVSPIWLKRYFHLQQGGYFIINGLRRSLDFRFHNLLAEPFEDDFDLIVCRNVVIYFTAEVKTNLYARFQAALRTGGVLFLGGTEVISKPAELGFTPAGMSFYQRNLSG